MRPESRRMRELELRVAALEREAIQLREAQRILRERLHCADSETAEWRERWEKAEATAEGHAVDDR